MLARPAQAASASSLRATSRCSARSTPAPARASAIARDARVTRQAVAQVVAELEQLDIIEQAPDPTDARAKLVGYATFGLDGYRRAPAVFTELEREHVQLLGPTRIATLKQDLRSLSESGTR